MGIFQNEINISKIYTVMKYETEEITEENEWESYPFALYCYELVYYVDNENITFFAGETFHNTPGKLLFLPKGMKDAGYRVKKITTGFCLDIYFDTDADMPKHAVSVSKTTIEMQNMFQKLYNIWNAKSNGYYVKAMALFYEIIAKLMNYNAGYKSLLQKNRFDLVEDYMNQHFCEGNFDYQELAKIAELSYPHFKKLFVSFYGMPPSKYIMNRRIKYARELLVTKRYSVSEIAAKCGYSDIYYFSTVFKKVYGVAPSLYKATEPTRY